jgi:hypothetical protein
VLARFAGCARAVSSKSVLAFGCARMEETGLVGCGLRVELRRRWPRVRLRWRGLKFTASVSMLK